MKDVLIAGWGIECRMTKCSVKNASLRIVMHAGTICFHARNAQSFTAKKMIIHVKDAVIITVPDVTRIKTYASSVSVTIGMTVSSCPQKIRQTKYIGLDSRTGNVFVVAREKITAIKRMSTNLVQPAHLATMRALERASNAPQNAKTAIMALHAQTAPRDTTLAMAVLSVSLA